MGLLTHTNIIVDDFHYGLGNASYNYIYFLSHMHSGSHCSQRPLPRAFERLGIRADILLRNNQKSAAEQVPSDPKRDSPGPQHRTRHLPKQRKEPKSQSDPVRREPHNRLGDVPIRRVSSSNEATSAEYSTQGISVSTISCTVTSRISTRRTRVSGTKQRRFPRASRSTS